MRFLGEGSAFECCHWADANLITEGKLSILSPNPWKATVNKKHPAIRCQGLIWSAAKYVTNHWQEVSPEGTKRKKWQCLGRQLLWVCLLGTGKAPTASPDFPEKCSLPDRSLISNLLHIFLWSREISTELGSQLESYLTQLNHLWQKRKNLVSQFISKKIEEIWKLMQIKVKREMIS